MGSPSEVEESVASGGWQASGLVDGGRCRFWGCTFWEDEGVLKRTQSGFVGLRQSEI